MSQSKDHEPRAVDDQQTKRTRKTRNRSRRRFLIAVAGTTSVGLAGCTGGNRDDPQPGADTPPGDDTSGGDGTQPGEDTTGDNPSSPAEEHEWIPNTVLRQAREQGRVVVYHTIDQPDLEDPIKPTFEARFPEITAELTGFSPPEVASKLVSEKRTGNVQVDVAATATGTARAIDSAGVYRELANDHWLKQQAEEMGYADAYWRHPQARRYELPGFGLPYTLLYNTDHISEGEAPDSWEDLADPQWDGQIAHQHPLHLGATGGLLATLWGTWDEEKWREIIQGWADNNPRLTSGNSGAYRTVAQGERSLSPNYINDLVAQLAEGEDPPITTVWPEPSIQLSIPQYFVADSPNPHAGMVWMSWSMSEEGQQTIGNTGRTPIHGPTASSHDLFRGVIPEGVTIQPVAFNNPTYQGASFIENPEAWEPLFSEFFGGV